MPVAPPSGGNDSDQPDPSTPIYPVSPPDQPDPSTPIYPVSPPSEPDPSTPIYSQSPPDPPAVSDPTPPDIPVAPISNQPDPSTPIYYSPPPPPPVYYAPPPPTYNDWEEGWGGGYGYGPVVLDLTGHGIKITQKTSSNQFFDMAGDGYEHLTAWAGAGNAVLFFDATGQGALTRADQVVFTDLDPSAKTDMQALLDVFDTNHDGKLDAGDASFADFFLDVTNANGTTSVETLAQAAVASINLVPSAVEQALPDGSSIDGETTYTTTSGTTGLAATVTFAFDANGYAVVTSTSTNSDGSTTIDVVTSAPSGGVVYERLLNTSSTGLVKTLTTLNAGGNVETIQTDATVVNGTGSAETLTDYRYGTIAASNHSGALGASVSTTGAEKLDSTQTTISTSGGVTTTTILRDQLGGGWTTQKEVDTLNADGSSSIAVSDLNFDGSASLVTTTQVSANGLTRTVTRLVDGIAADSTTSVDATVVNGDSSRTETVTAKVGTTTIGTATTQISVNGTVRTTSSDLDGSGSIDRVSTAATVLNGDGSTTTTQVDTTAGGTLIDASATTTSGNGLTITTKSDTNAAGTVAAPVFDQTEVNATVYTGTSYRTVTDTVTSANGTVRSQTVTKIYPDGVTRTVTQNNTGDGSNDHSETVAVSNGVTTDTIVNRTGNGRLVNETVVTTASGGLSTTTSVDRTGAVTNTNAPIFDHVTTDVTVKNADGSSTETVTLSGGGGAVIDKTQTVVSANGLTTTTSEDLNGAGGVPDGTFDRVTIDAMVVNTDSSLTETITLNDANGHVLEQVVKNTSADRRTVTTTTTLGTTGLAKTVETVLLQSAGSTVDTVIQFDKNGDVLGATATTTSADGLTKTVQQDVQGQTASVYAASGLAFDQTTSDVTVINADGSRTETVNVKSQNATLVSTTATTTSANGLSVTATSNPYATAHYASQTTDVTTLNADGSTTETASLSSYSGALIDRTVRTVSATGLSTVTTQDLDGDGVVDRATSDVITINADGSQTEVVTDYTGGTTGTVRDVTTTTKGVIVAGAGQTTTINRQSFGSVPFYSVETVSTAPSGTVTDLVQIYASVGGALLHESSKTTSATGLLLFDDTAVNGDSVNDFWTQDTEGLNADGSTTENVSKLDKTAFLSEVLTTTSANGLWITTSVDANGALANNSPAFNRITTDDTVFNTADGSQTETVTNKANNGTTILQTVRTTSADQQTITTTSYLDETGTIGTADRVETTQTQANGSVQDTAISYDANHAPLSTVTTTKSGNGLVMTTVYQNGAGATVDTQSDTTTYDSNGDGGTLDDVEDADTVTGTTVLRSSMKTQAVANAQSETITMALSGALASTIAASFSAVTNASVAIADSGVTTKTITDKLNGASTASDVTSVVTSANQRSTTTSTTLGTASSPYIVQQDTLALDGSETKTTTYYNPATSTIMEQTTVNTSYDGRTITTSRELDPDQVNQSAYSHAANDPYKGSTLTLSFPGPYNTETDTYSENADGTVTETRSGTGSFGALAYSQIKTAVTNPDSSQTSTIRDFDGLNVVDEQFVLSTAPNGLAEGVAFDTTGLEATANLVLASSDLASGTAVPTTLLATDIIGVASTSLAVDGSQTKTVKTAYGSSLSNTRSLTTTTTSANGLTTTTSIDNDGNGIAEQVATTVIAANGSKTETFKYFGDTTATATTLQGSNVYTVSANGLITTLTTSTGMTDTTVDFLDSNGSYEYSRTVTAGSAAYNSGYRSASASHFVDANGIDTWSWYDPYSYTGAPVTGSITIDLATEKQDIAIANELCQTLYGHTMDDAETQNVGNYIVNGVLDREQLAYDMLDSAEYSFNYAVTYTVNGTANQSFQGFGLFAALQNALGRLPTAEEMGVFDQDEMLAITNETGAVADYDQMALTAVAVAEYATNQGISNDRSTEDANGDLLSQTGDTLAATAPTWIAPASNPIQIQTAGTFSYTGSFITDLNATTSQGVAATINGNNNVIVLDIGSTLTLSGFNNSIYDSVGTATINASTASILVDLGAIGTVSGSNDEIAQVGPTSLTLSSGTGDVIDIAPGLSAHGASYTLAYSTTNASNAAITFLANAGAAAADLLNGSNDAITLGGNNAVTVSGTGNSINVIGNGDLIGANNTAITVSAGFPGLIITNGIQAYGATDIVNGNGDTITLAGTDALTLNGTGETINVLGSSDNIVANAANITFAASLIVLSVAGANDTVTLSGNDVATLSASDTIVANGAANAVTISDTAANVVANLAALNAAASITAITMTDSGTPVLALTAAQVANDTIALGKITNAYTITVSDTAANVSSAIAALNANTHLTSIALTDSGTPSLVLTAAQVATDTTALGKITSAYHITVSDTAANVSARFDTLNANTHTTAITLTDPSAPKLSLTATQGHNDTTALGEITNASYAIGYTGVTGLGYSSYEDLLNGSHSIMAEAQDLTSGGGNLLLNGNGLTVADSGSALGATSGSNTYALTAHANESITATGTGETIQYAAGFGQSAVSSFLASGTGADTIQFNVSMFSYLTPSMTQAQDATALLSHANQVGANVTIADTPGDTLTLNSITKATLAASSTAFKFV